MAKSKVSSTDIIHTAFKVLANGPALTSLSLRAIANALAIDVSTIYWHFENKQAVLQAMADEIARQIGFPNNELPWKEQLMHFYTNVFDTYMKYPHSAELMMSTIPATKVRLSLIDYAIGILVSAGFSEDESNTAMSSIDFLLTGLVIDLTTENKFRANIMNAKDDYIASQIAQVHTIVKKENLMHMQASIKKRNQLTPKYQFEKGMELIIKGLSVNRL